MNILLKNADFSSVSIGTAGVLTPASVLTNANLRYNNDNKMQYVSSLFVYCYDISNMKDNDLLKLVYYIGSQKTGFYFMSGVCPTQNRTFISQDDINTFYGGLGNLLSYGYFADKSNGTYTDIISLVSGAKTLLLSVGSVKTGKSVTEIIA